MKPEKMIDILCTMFVVIGTIFIVVGIVLFCTFSDTTDKAETSAIITDIIYRGHSGESNNYDVIVAYEVDGEEYETCLNEYSSSFYVGKEIDINYDVNNPHRIYSKFTYKSFTLIFSGIGLVFFVMGAIGLVGSKVRKSEIKSLRENGEVIYADYIKVSINPYIRVNNRCPFIIVCEWKNLENRENYLFKSENIWEDPEYIIREKGITKFPVYVKPNCYKKYVIDIDEIKSEI